MKKERLGFTLVETVLTIFVVVLLLALLLPLLSGGPRRHIDRQIHDAAQVREIHKGLVMWAQQNNDRFPLPAEIDRDDATLAVAGDATMKNSTAAICSTLIYNSLVTPDILVSPHEVNPAITVYRRYEYTEPTSANDPANARWDPGFRGTPLDPGPDGKPPTKAIGHTSYAHLAVAGLGRLAEWGSTLSADYAVLGNRGPEETGGTWDAETGEITSTTLAEGPTGTQSFTLLINGSDTAWEGNIAYNDNHVNFETTTYPEHLRYIVTTAVEQSTFGDGLFLDEGDSSNLSGVVLEDTRDANCYLGLFRRGPTQAERHEHAQAVKYIKQARWFDGMTE